MALGTGESRQEGFIKDADARLIVTGSPAGSGTPIASSTAPLTTVTVSRVAASATVVTLIAANTARRGLKIYNESASATLYVKDGATATITDYSVQVPPGGYYEYPRPMYTGIVTGLWTAAVGAAQITQGV